MKETKFGARFFESTRGRIVSLLRGKTSTVNELAEELDLTDNAVRSHLLTLERDSLIRQSGTQRGHRKPHFAYELTPEAEHLFPKSYDALFNVLLGVLKKRLAPDELSAVLREVGRIVAAQTMSESTTHDDLPTKAERAAQVLGALGGAPRLIKEENKIMIDSASCPVGTAVAEHPEVCRLAEALVAQITGERVRENCNKTQNPPRCLFEIKEKKRRDK